MRSRLRHVRHAHQPGAASFAERCEARAASVQSSTACRAAVAGEPVILGDSARPSARSDAIIVNGEPAGPRMPRDHALAKPAEQADRDSRSEPTAAGWRVVKDT